MNYLKIWFIINMLVFSAYLCRAEDKPPAPRERALSERITAEINNNIQCSTNVQTLLDRIKELESKSEEKGK